MSKVQAFKCDNCGSVFESDEPISFDGWWEHEKSPKNEFRVGMDRYSHSFHVCSRTCLGVIIDKWINGRQAPADISEAEEKAS